MPPSRALESRRSMTRRVIAAYARRSPIATTSRQLSQRSGSWTSISLAPGRLSCATRCATAYAWPKPTARRRCATSVVCGAARCGSRRRRLCATPELTAPARHHGRLTQSDGEIGEREAPKHLHWSEVFERKRLLLPCRAARDKPAPLYCGLAPTVRIDGIVGRASGLRPDLRGERWPIV